MTSGDWKIWACSEFCGITPNGEIKPSDAKASQPHWRVDAGQAVTMSAPRNGWVSLRLVVEGKGDYSVACEVGGLGCDLFREFYHRLEADPNTYLPDALVPIESGSSLRIPAPGPCTTARSICSTISGQGASGRTIPEQHRVGRDQLALDPLTRVSGEK